MRIECNLAKWEHLNEDWVGCDVTLFWKCQCFHRSQRETQMRIECNFDRVGPFERDRVFVVMSLSFGNATVSIVRIECNSTEWDHLHEAGFGCDVTLCWEMPPFPSLPMTDRCGWSAILPEWDHLNEIGFGCDVTLFWKCHRFHRCQ